MDKKEPQAMELGFCLVTILLTIATVIGFLLAEAYYTVRKT